MRVLHLIPSMGGGGAERELSLLAGPLARQCDLHVALIREGPNFARLAASGATIHRLRAASNYDPRLVMQVFSLVRRLRPDVMQTWLTQMDVLGGAIAARTRTPRILSERASAAYYPPTLKNRLRVALARGAALVQANSAEGAKYWAVVQPHVPRVVIPNAVAVHEIEATPALDRQALSGGRRIILAAGRFDRQKNVERLVDALALVLRRHDDAIAVVAGHGPQEEEIRRIVAKLGLGERFRLPGYISDLWSWMKAASVFVSVSHFEGQPNVVVEAAACRCPQVLSDIPEHRELLGDCRSALLVDRRDPEAIAAAIENVLDAPTAAAERAARAFEVVAHWTPPEIAARHIEIYERVLAALAAPARAIA
jgi:glycosyltransferase involved in cell wall biosynthesis